MMDNITLSLRAAAELSQYLCGLLLFVCYIQCYMFSDLLGFASIYQNEVCKTQ